jgi:hypothetical protein
LSEAHGTDRVARARSMIVDLPEAMMSSDEQTMTPRQRDEHTARLMRQAEQECRADIGRIQDPKAQALFETEAEVLLGGIKALEDYIHQREPVWRSAT